MNNPIGDLILRKSAKSFSHTLKGGSGQKTRAYSLFAKKDANRAKRQGTKAIRLRGQSSEHRVVYRKYLK